ncbi:MAG TPA: Rid family hydrolase [Steroidobacteraceae bacterium]|jgi:2-iminobutanoate/2-iminopropanoate deaminase
MKPLAIFLCGVLAVYCAVRSVAGESPRSDDPSYHMKRQIIRIPDAPKSPLYSQAVKVGPTLYVTGVAGLDPQTNKVAGPTIQEQTRQALINCESILRAGGAKLDDVVEVQVLLARPGDFAGLNEEYAKFFPQDPPVRSVARLGPELGDILVSIKMIAVISD